MADILVDLADTSVNPAVTRGFFSSHKPGRRVFNKIDPDLTDLEHEQEIAFRAKLELATCRCGRGTKIEKRSYCRACNAEYRSLHRKMRRQSPQNLI